MNALGRHVALVGFMGAGKSTLGPQLATRLGRPFVSVDDLVEERVGSTVAELFEVRGEAAFRELEEEAALDVLARRDPVVLELGGGALGSARTRAAVEASALALLLEVDVDEAWRRVGSGERPLAKDPERFRRLHADRQPVYESVADASPRDLDGALLACAGIHVESGALTGLRALVPGESPIALVVDERVAMLYGDRASHALGDRLLQTIAVAEGEAAKTPGEAERLWRALRLDRGGTLVSLGGGSTSDLTGFAAAAYLRGVPWVPVPTTLVGQVDAAIGGKTGVDLVEGKNLVGAFHWPVRTVIDPELLDTLPEAERVNGLAEVVKTGLLAGEPLWELARDDQVRRCAAFKAGVCLRDPYDLGERAQLNLGHTFAHALEAAAGYSLPHGRAVALGLLAALRLSGLEEDARAVEAILGPERVPVEREVAWAALARDKKSVDGRVRLVLLEAPGKPRVGVEVDPESVRAALDSLIA